MIANPFSCENDTQINTILIFLRTIMKHVIKIRRYTQGSKSIISRQKIRMQNRANSVYKGLELNLKSD